MVSQSHIEIAVKLNPVCAELVADFLAAKFNCNGVVMEETVYKDLKIVSEVKNIVKGYFWNNPENLLSNDEIIQKVLAHRNELLKFGISDENLGEWSVELKEVKDEDWAHSWKNFWHPQKIGSKLVISPTWENYQPKKDEILLELDPGSAFGTGTHATTKLCILALEKYLNSGDVVGDIGTGSGILSLAALKFGAKSSLGVDNDPLVIEVAKENAEKNNLSDKTYFYEGSANDVHQQFDFVTANILHNVLIDIMGDLRKILKPQAKIVLSGIIKEKEQAVLNEALKNNFELVEILEEDNWVAIVLQAV